MQLVSTGGPGVLAIDNGANDDPRGGVITNLYSDAVFTTSVTTGASKPAYAASPADMDLNNFTLNATGAETLTISLTDTDFNGNGNGGTLIQDGAAAPTVALVGRHCHLHDLQGPGKNHRVRDDARVQHARAVRTGSILGDTGGSPWSAGRLLDDPGRHTRLPTAAGSMSFDFSSINDSPEPSTLAIAGLGVLGLVGYGLRRRPA